MCRTIGSVIASHFEMTQVNCWKKFSMPSICYHNLKAFTTSCQHFLEWIMSLTTLATTIYGKLPLCIPIRRNSCSGWTDRQTNIIYIMYMQCVALHIANRKPKTNTQPSFSDGYKKYVKLRDYLQKNYIIFVSQLLDYREDIVHMYAYVYVCMRLCTFVRGHIKTGGQIEHISISVL